MQVVCAAFVAAVLVSPAVYSQSPAVEYNRDVRPIFSDKCFACHGPDAANRKTKLRLDIEQGSKIPLARGKVSIAEGDPKKSEVFARIVSDNKALRMPPAHLGHEKLSEREIEIVRQWIEGGAKYQSHWSFLAPTRPAASGIDELVLGRLQREGLKPSSEADRRTLLRRLTLDLTGLPPALEEVDGFVNDKSPNAYEKAVDRLLASTRHAERMTFRWMEAARYADTNGYQSDGIRDMYRWRDWVIEAYRSNMSFDRFTIEQIAGDLLPNATLEQKMATAFHRNHRTSAEGGIVPEEFRVEYVADRAETTSTVWLGLTVGCARCHDHKYDPILQKDFYRLFAFFNNIPEKGLVYNWGNDEPLIKAPTPEQQQRLDKLDLAVRHASGELADLNGEIDKAQKKWEKNAAKLKDWFLSDGLVFRYADGAAKDTEIKGSAQPVSSPVGQGREFDGKTSLEADEKIANFNYLDPFTFSAWIKPASADGSILSHDEDFAEGSGHGLHLVKGKLRLHVVFRWTDIGMRLETVENIKLGEWQHVAVTYDGKRYASGVQMYVNGQPQKLNVLFDDLNWPMNFKVPFRIGAGSGMRFKGAIDDVRVYKRELSAEEAAVIALADPVSAIARKSVGKRTPVESDKLRMSFLDVAAPSEVRQAISALQGAKSERDKYYASLPTLMVMQEGPKRQAYLLKRGAYDAPGEAVEPGVPSALPQLPADWPQNRLGLAKWLVDRSNPLTARVQVNRVWQMLFGTGLVKTVEDFGSQGEWPLNMELLDWLAVEFMDSGWNVRHLLKTIVMSSTYRQDSRVTPELMQKDPENRWLARGARLRLGPEILRDQALAVSGLLVEKTGGPSVKPYQPPGLWKELAGGREYEADKGDGLYRRSLYTFWKRTVAPPFMVNFDSPSREVCTVRETRTNTPLQALNLMNDVTYLEAARKLAERMLREGGETPDGRIDWGYRAVLGRGAKPNEIATMTELVERFRAKYERDKEGAEKLLSQGASPRAEGLKAKETAAYAVAASLLLNLDEAVTKE